MSNWDLHILKDLAEVILFKLYLIKNMCILDFTFKFFFFFVVLIVKVLHQFELSLLLNSIDILLILIFSFFFNYSSFFHFTCIIKIHSALNEKSQLVVL